MLGKLEHWLWGLNRWLHYGISVALTLAVILIRLYSQPYLEDRAPMVLSTVPVAIAGFIGGLFPGLLATVLSLIFTLYLFVPPVLSFSVRDGGTLFSVIAFVCVWVFISAVCEKLRNTALRNTQIALERDSERSRLSAILASVTDGFFSVDSTWTIVRTNAPFDEHARRLGIVPGRRLWEAIPEHRSSPLGRALEHTMSERAVSRLDVGDLIEGHWFHVRAEPAEDGGVYIFAQDITERKELERQREGVLEKERHARTEAERASRLKDDFLATVSHELRTPLTSLLGWIEFLQSRERLSGTGVDGLVAMDRSARHLCLLIDELLDVSRIQANKVTLTLLAVDLVTATREAVETALPAARAKGVELQVDAGAKSVTAYADPSRLQQILANLLSNAVKFTPRDGAVTVVIEPGTDFHSLVVRDTGLGIDADFLPYVFERFQQAASSANRAHGGLGIGLAIARQLALLHGGDIVAESAGLGQGTKFTVRLPAAKSAAPSGESEPAAEGRRKPKSAR